MSCTQCGTVYSLNFRVGNICLCPKCCHQTCVRRGATGFVNNDKLPVATIQLFKNNFENKIIPEINEAYKSGTVYNCEINKCRVCNTPNRQQIFDRDGQIKNLLRINTDGFICHRCSQNFLSR